MVTWGGEPPAGAGDAQRTAPAGFQLVSPADWQAALRARRRRRTCRVIGWRHYS